MRNALKKAVVGLPHPILLPILKARRNLAYSLPPNMEIIWPYYLGDVKVHINSSNAIELWMFRDYEEGIGQRLNNFVKAGDYCLDVGANIGAVSVMMAKYVGAKGKVLSFEPGPPYLKRLESNIALNPGMEKIITVVQQGLSDKPGELTWTADEDHPYNAAMVEGLVHGKGVTVPVTTLDDYFAAHPWPRLDFLKVDVESMELEVLRGGSAALARFKPTVVFETYADFRMSRGFDIFKACEDLMRGLGYNLYSMDDAGKLIEVTADTMSMDTIAIHQSKPTTLLKA
jgi:FkbM family methyltransferase